MRHAVVIEKTEGDYSAYVPDLPGCVATGDSVVVVARIGSAPPTQCRGRANPTYGLLRINPA